MLAVAVAFVRFLGLGIGGTGSGAFSLLASSIVSLLGIHQPFIVISNMS